MRSLGVAAVCVGLGLLPWSSVTRTVGQEKKQGSVGNDLEVLWGNGETAWQFEKKDSRNRIVRLYFSKPRGGNPTFGRMTRGTGKVLAERFEYSLGVREGKRYLDIAILVGGKSQRELFLPYRLEGDKLHILEGKDQDLDLKGVWKRVPLK
jgi:hypothetical protein